MPWLRLDDGFTANGKIGQLSDSEFRVWIRLLCHCAKSQDPSVDSLAIREVSGLSSKRVQRFAQIGLLDPVGDLWEVHDWAKYLPKDATNAERQAAWRARKRNAERNGSSVTDPVTETAPRARAHADSRPVPSRKAQPEAVALSVVEPEPPDDHDRTALGDFIDTLELRDMP